MKKKADQNLVGPVRIGLSSSFNLAHLWQLKKTPGSKLYRVFFLRKLRESLNTSWK